MNISWENTWMKNPNKFGDCQNRERKYCVETGDLQIFRHIFKSVRNKVIVIKKFAIRKISSKYFQRMNFIGFQEFSALAPLLQLVIFSRFGHFSMSWHWFCTNCSFGIEKNVEGWEKSINFFYILSSNDHILFMTKYGCLWYEHELRKVFYPLFKSFLPPSSMFFPTIIHIQSSKIQNGSMEGDFSSKFTFIFYECSGVGKKLLKWG